MKKAGGGESQELKFLGACTALHLLLYTMIIENSSGQNESMILLKPWELSLYLHGPWFYEGY